MVRQGDNELAERQLSGGACSTSSAQSTGLSKRPRREDGSRQKRPGAAAGGKLRLFRNPELLPFSSVLTSYFASQDSLGKATDFTAVALEFDWMQQAVGTANNLKHLLAGAMSAILSKTVTAPLERVKMEMQLKQKQDAIKVARELAADGYLSFWKGNGMNLLRVTPHKAINFYSFYLYRTALGKALKHIDVKGTDRFFAGALAGSTATLMCFPLDVIRTRMLGRAGDKYSTAIGTVKTMLKEESLASFYVGCLPAVVSTAASGALFYGIYDLLKERYFRSQRARDPKAQQQILVLGAGRTLLYGALAGAAAESILYPLEVLRRRMQLQSMQATEVVLQAQQVERMTLAAATERGLFAEAGIESVPRLHRMAAAALTNNYLRKAMNAAMEIYKMDGVPGFYQGIAPHILQVLPSAALSYYFYEACKRALKVEE